MLYSAITANFPFRFRKLKKDTVVLEHMTIKNSHPDIVVCVGHSYHEGSERLIFQSQV